MFNSLNEKWKSRKKYRTFKEMPTAFVTYFGVSGVIVSGGYGSILKKVVPSYLDVVDKIPLAAWGWKGWFVTAFLASICLVTWIFSSIAWRCNNILRERLFI
jgi:hypothetical protein